jgi:hypothetical protein
MIHSARQWITAIFLLVASCQLDCSSRSICQQGVSAVPDELNSRENGDRGDN